jgi:hypothetical protein
MTRAIATSPIEAGPTSHHFGASPAHDGTGPSAEVVVTGNSNPDLGLFGGLAKGVK